MRTTRLKISALVAAVRASCTGGSRRPAAAIRPAVPIAAPAETGPVDWAALFRSALEDSPHGVAFSDPAACFRYSNPAFQRLLGYHDAAQVLGRWLFEFLAFPEQSASILHGLREQGFWMGQAAARRRDCSVFPAEISAHWIGGKRGTAGWVHWRIVDLTGRMGVEYEELRQAKSITLKGAGLAHDLNNLLTVIAGNSHLALSGLGTPGSSRRLWSEVLETSQLAVEITHQFMAMSRQQELRAPPVSPNSVLANARELFARLAGDRVAIRTSLAGDAGTIRISPSEFQQVLMNLVLNARDAMPSGGTLTIETARQDVDPGSRNHEGLPAGSYVLVTVTDTGTGMDDATRSRAFEAFFSSKPGDQGAGLGLAIVSAIVRKAGGHIRVTTQVGAGTAFRLYFPEAGRG